VATFAFYGNEQSTMTNKPCERNYLV
jgi:hypothetical protein